MSERGIQLHKTASGQISELIGVLATRCQDALSLPCPGREKIGDGTIAACALHTADRYQLIAEFLQAAGQKPSARAAATQRGRRVPRFLLARGHGPENHGGADHGEGMHDDDYTAKSTDLDGLLERLSAALDALRPLAELTDEQLQTVPPAGSFRFCDGQRTLAQVAADLLKHQDHQINALKTALA